MVALVLLPGLDGTGHLFADFVAALPSGLEVIVAHYPTDKPLSYADLEPIARNFLPLNQEYFLLGESFSGPLAITIAATAPPRLRGLILCCSFARNPFPLFAGFRRLLGVLPVADAPLSLLSYFLMGRFSTAGLRMTLKNTLSLVTADVLRQRARAVLAVDVSDSLAIIKMPVLYLRATEDRIVPPSSSQLVAALATQTKIVDLLGPHFLLQVLPSAAAAVVANFMGLVTPGSHPLPQKKETHGRY